MTMASGLKRTWVSTELALEEEEGGGCVVATGNGLFVEVRVAVALEVAGEIGGKE